eukprot:Nk52_evm98s352 gene=Nk52_evmTU98s352
MSHFTHHQARRYQRVFDRFSETVPGRLGLIDLYNAMPMFGPQLAVTAVKKLIYRYDRSRDGFLDFEDFLELLADYEVTCEQMEKMVANAFETTFAKLCPGEEGISRQVFGHILQMNSDFKYREVDEVCTDAFPQYGSKMKCEKFFEVMKAHTTWIKNPPIDRIKIGKVTIRIKVNKARNLEIFSRVKCREHLIALKSIDAALSISIAGNSQKSTVEIGNLSPYWNHTVEFNVIFPTYDISEAQAWIEGQSICFRLFDNEVNGVVPHLDWLAHGSIPLDSVMYEPSSSMYSLLKLRLDNLPSGVIFKNGPELDLTISVIDDTSLSLNNGEIDSDHFVADFFQSKEGLWLDKYETTFKNTISKSFATRGVEEARSLGGKVSGYLNKLSRELGWKLARRRRIMSMCGISESGDFLLLPCFVTPVHLTQDTIDTWQSVYKSTQSVELSAIAVSPIQKLPPLEQIFAVFVSRFPLSEDKLTARDTVTNEGENGNGPKNVIFANTTLYDVNAEKNDFTFISNPSSFLVNCEGSHLEHSLFLLGILLGMGRNAYVSVGIASKKIYSWVTVLEPLPMGVDTDHASKRESAMSLMSYVDLSPKPSMSQLSHESPFESSFANFKSSEFLHQDSATAEELPIYHIDPISGRFFKQFENGSISQYIPFETIGSMFNDKEVYLNIGETFSLKKMSNWNLKDSSVWYRVLSDKSYEEWGSPRPCYSSPFCMSSLEPLSPSFNTNLLHDVTSAIQGYRRHSLFVPKTLFHLEASLSLTEFIDPLERRYHPLSNEYPHLIQFEKDILQRIENKVVGVIPPGHVWKGRIFHFFKKDASGILEELIRSGFVDCTVQGTAYACALKAYPWPFGLCSVWVILGQITKLT